MEESILNSTKKILGLEPTYTPFDLDVITHINAAFSLLDQLGVGPEGGFHIEDDTAVWSDFINAPPNQLYLVKTYIYLKVRMLFDPPSTSFLIEATNNQIKEYEWRLNVFREVELPPVEEQQLDYLRDKATKLSRKPRIPAGRRWIDVNINPITGEPLDQ
jgi:hypothetical protein